MDLSTLTTLTWGVLAQRRCRCSYKKVVGAGNARTDNLVSRPRSGDDKRKRIPASIARRIVTGFNDQPLTVPGT